MALIRACGRPHSIYYGTVCDATCAWARSARVRTTTVLAGARNVSRKHIMDSASGECARRSKFFARVIISSSPTDLPLFIYIYTCIYTCIYCVVFNYISRAPFTRPGCYARASRSEAVYIVYYFFYTFIYICMYIIYKHIFLCVYGCACTCVCADPSN